MRRSSWEDFWEVLSIFGGFVMAIALLAISISAAIILTIKAVQMLGF